jgi:hypothetical protein
VRYLSLAEALVIAEAVTGIDTDVLSKTAAIDLLDSALHAPQASFGGEEFYPYFVDKAAVLGRANRSKPSPLRREQTAGLGVSAVVLRP